MLKLILFWPIAFIQGIFLFFANLFEVLIFGKGLKLELARKRDLLRIQMIILEGYNINEQNAFGQSLLHAVFFDTLENSVNPSMAIKVLEFLIDNGADVNMVDKRNWSPLLYAIAANYTDESIYLINTKKILLNKQFYEGRTALHYAVIKNNIAVTKHLLEKGADLEICDNFGLSPIQGCKSKKMLEVFTNNKLLKTG